jgi:6-phosphogluconolactonase
VQSGAQSHATIADRSGSYVFVASKGDDLIAQYLFDTESGLLSANTPGNVSLPEGSGPRQLVSHPSGNFIYLLNETSHTLSAFALGTSGALSSISPPLSSTDTLEEEATGSGVVVHPGGRFLYASNRAGTDSSIATFSVDPVSGAPSRISVVSSHGDRPRSIAVSPDGKFLVCGNRTSNDIAIFRIDTDDGEPEFSHTLPLTLSPFFVSVVALPR